jgi:hypothetical protein
MAGFSTMAFANDGDTARTLEIECLTDAYYGMLFDGSGDRGTSSYSPVGFRYYDSENNSLTYNMTELIFHGQSDNVNLDAGLAFGPWADAMAGSETTLKNISFATVSIDPWQNGWKFSVGKMLSHIGLEGPRAHDNINYSRSFIFGYGTSTWHTGVRAAYSSDKTPWFGGAHIYNGWGVVSDNNSAKTFGFTVGRSLENATLTYNNCFGPEQTGNTSRWRFVQDLNLVTKISALELAVDAVYGSEALANSAGDAKWYGIEGIITHSLAERTKVSGRLEWYRDDTGFTLGTVPTSLVGVTFTLKHQVAAPLQVLAELRYDHAQDSIFVRDMQLHDSQTTLTIAVLGRI